MSASIGKVLLTHEQIVDRCEELGTIISRDYQDKNLVIVGLLNGSVPFLAELVKHISLPLRFDFVRAKSYCGTTMRGKLELVHDLDLDIHGQDVLVVDDILDSGQTMSCIATMMEEKGAKSVRTCCLLMKLDVKKDYEVHLDYCGFEIPNEFVIGFGLDYDELYRNLPYIGVLKLD